MYALDRYRLAYHFLAFRFLTASREDLDLAEMFCQTSFLSRSPARQPYGLDLDFRSSKIATISCLRADKECIYSLVSIIKSRTKIRNDVRLAFGKWLDSILRITFFSCLYWGPAPDWCSATNVLRKVGINFLKSSRGEGKVPENVGAEKETAKSNDEANDEIETGAFFETKSDIFEFVKGSCCFKMGVGVEVERADGKVSLWHRFSTNEGKGSRTSFAQRWSSHFAWKFLEMRTRVRRREGECGLMWLQ